MANAPPPSSQSHFDKFADFVPDNKASFDDEFSRLASSQSWVSGTQEYRKQRTIAMRSELELHYFSQSQDVKEEPEPTTHEKEQDGEPQQQQQQQPVAGGNNHRHQQLELTDEQRLQGYQALCVEVGIPPSDSIDECKRNLKKQLVNIVDLVDARRTGEKVDVWSDFEAFRMYTLDDEHRFDREEARQNGGLLESLLQHLRNPRRGKRHGRNRRKGQGAASRGAAGRVTKRTSRAHGS